MIIPSWILTLKYLSKYGFHTCSISLTTQLFLKQLFNRYVKISDLYSWYQFLTLILGHYCIELGSNIDPQYSSPVCLCTCHQIIDCRLYRVQSTQDIYYLSKYSHSSQWQSRKHCDSGDFGRYSSITYRFLLFTYTNTDILRASVLNLLKYRKCSYLLVISIGCIKYIRQIWMKLLQKHQHLSLSLNRY